MKKKQSLPIALIATFCLAIPSYSQSEWTHTGNWKHLLLGKKNPHITDSLVILDFEGGKYQIPYSVEGKHDYFYPKETFHQILQPKQNTFRLQLSIDT